jgi:hypothetical protein
VRGEASLDEALRGFSGYVAADELYDGPFCVLFLVDNRNFRRLAYEVLDHNPTQEDIRRFFARFRAELERRGLALRGITTDGSPLYPEPIAGVFGEAPHQVCEFHVLKELGRAVLGALAEARKGLAAGLPDLPRGRPAAANSRTAARRRRRKQKIQDLFESRHLFVRRSLTPGETKTLRRITRGEPGLRALREVMDEVYRLFDRRCRTETALGKLSRLRRRIRRFAVLRRILRKLFSPSLEKALTFLDDKLLPATSNAVERTNRRHRKMQKTVYRVRTKAHVSGRIALDLLREARAEPRLLALGTLHDARRPSQRLPAPRIARFARQETA